MALDKTDVEDVKKLIQAYLTKLFYILYTKQSFWS